MACSATKFWCEAPEPLNLILWWFLNSSPINSELLKIPLLVWYPLIATLPLKGRFCLDIFSSAYIHLMINTHITTDMVNKDKSSRIYHMDLTCPLCGRSYLEPAEYSDLRTPSVQAEDYSSWDLAPSYYYSWLYLLYWIENYPFQTHRQHTSGFHSWPLPWNFLAPS